VFHIVTWKNWNLCAKVADAVRMNTAVVLQYEEFGQYELQMCYLTYSALMNEMLLKIQ